MTRAIQQTKMRAEIEEIPEAIKRLLNSANGTITKAADELKRVDPQLIVTNARGSSDHAATYLKYAIELNANVPVASLGPSTSSIYGQTLKLANAASISISQSGKSPDIVQMAKSTKTGGAIAIAITNDTTSPLASSSDYSIDIHAGLEQSVAATKTFVTSIVAGLLLLAKWQDDEMLLEALEKLPDHAVSAINCDWHSLMKRLGKEDSLFIIGRGPSMAIANEVALKFKETCQIQGEAYSSAEVLHGPVSIVGANYPVLALAARDASLDPLNDVVENLVQQGADVYITASAAKNANLIPFCETGHPLTDPLMSVISFYGFVEALARQRGLNPDIPPNLRKVTETV